MEISYLILAHKNMNQLARLISSLDAPNVYFYIHIDANTDGTELNHYISSRRNIIIISQREHCIWAHISIVQATLNGLSQIISDNRDGYVVLMSGQDYPLKGNTAISSLFDSMNGTIFMDVMSIPTANWPKSGLSRLNEYFIPLSKKRYDYLMIPPFSSPNFQLLYARLHSRPEIQTAINTYRPILEKPRERPTYCPTFYGGSQWWAMPIEAAHYINNFLEIHPDYQEYHRYTFACDEIFFHTIINNCDKFRDKIRPSLTYVNWTRKNTILPVTFRLSDFTELTERPECFARKFDNNLDSEILDCLDTHRQINPEKLFPCTIL